MREAWDGPDERFNGDYAGAVFTTVDRPGTWIGARSIQRSSIIAKHNLYPGQVQILPTKRAAASVFAGEETEIGVASAPTRPGCASIVMQSGQGVGLIDSANFVVEAARSNKMHRVDQGIIVAAPGARGTSALDTRNGS